jgi:hypothetical protein
MMPTGWACHEQEGPVGAINLYEVRHTDAATAGRDIGSQTHQGWRTNVSGPIVGRRTAPQKDDQNARISSANS